MKIYGTLEFGYNKYRKSDTFLLSGFQPTLIADRMIPTAWHSDRNKVEVDVNLVNTRYLRMIMREYPVTILDQGKWNECLQKLEDTARISDQLRNLTEANTNDQMFTGKLMNFQKKGLDFLLKSQGNALLADEMGLGKTVQTLAFVATAENTLPAVIISPLVTLRNWQREIKKFIRLQDDEDNPLEPRSALVRKGKQRALKESDFYIINYELVAKRVDDLTMINPRTIIMDEIHNLRNVQTQKYKSVDELTRVPSVQYRIGLSGTPIYNRGSEIWGIADVIKRGLLGSRTDFLKTYCYSYGDKYMVSEEKQKVLADILKENIMLRRKKIDVLTDLPEKNRFQQTVEIDERYYREEIDKMFYNIEHAKDMVNSTVGDDRKQKVFELNASYVKAIQQERQVAGISKAPYIAEYIKELMELDEKIVVFVHHHSVHDILMNALYDYEPLQIIGGQTDNQRQENIDKFQEDPKRKLIVCGIRAGSMGINLTKGNYVIFGELDWSPPVHKQAEDRLHRIGQKKPVFAHYLIGEGTMDETIANTLTDKTLEIDAVIGDKAEVTDNEKSRQVLEQLYTKFTGKTTSKIREMVVES
jgi:SNF2 family DNA or RNA helicase